MMGKRWLFLFSVFTSFAPSLCLCILQRNNRHKNLTTTGLWLTALLVVICNCIELKGFVYVFQNIKLQRVLANISTNGSFLVFSWQENQWWLPVMKPAGVGVKLWNCWSCLALSSTDITHVSDPPTEKDKHQHDAWTSVQCAANIFIKWRDHS